jgi:hypothetical protein
MKILRVASVAVAASLSVSAFPAAEAIASTFDWTITGPAADLGGVPLPGHGVLTATPDGGGAYSLDTISGEVGGFTITGPTSFFGSDNILYPDGLTYISTNGIAFTTTGPTVNIFSFYSQVTPPSGNAYGEYAGSAGFGVGTFTLLAVPEPSTWALTLIGFASLGLAVGAKASRLAPAT